MSSPIRAWLLTGPPGIGKSTVVTRTVYLLRMQGHGVGGCLTREKREGRERVGFTMTDLMSGREGELASTRGALGPRVGRYRVNLSTLTEIGARSLEDAAARADVIAIDEIGPMELTSPDFRKGAQACLGSGKPLLAVVHQQMKDPLIEKLRDMEGKQLTEVTLQNRDRLAETVSQDILARLAEPRP